MLQGSFHRQLLANVAVRRLDGQLLLAGVFFLHIHHSTVQRVDLVIVFPSVNAEFHLVDHGAVLKFQQHAGIFHLLLRQAGVLYRGSLRRVTADIILLAGLTNDLQTSALLRLLIHKQIQLVDRQRCQVRKGVAQIHLGDLIHQLSLAHRDSVLFCFLSQFRLLFYGLTQYRSVKVLGMQQFADLQCQLFLQCLGIGLFLAVHADKNRIGQLSDVAVADHRADDRVHCHIQPASRQIHFPENNCSVLVQCDSFQHPLMAIDPQLDAGIHIQ